MAETRVDPGLIQPENPRQSSGNVAEWPLVSAQVAQHHLAFGALVIPARNDFVSGMAPLHVITVANSSGAEYGRVTHYRLERNRRSRSYVDSFASGVGLLH